MQVILNIYVLNRQLKVYDFKSLENKSKKKPNHHQQKMTVCTLMLILCVCTSLSESE